GLAWTGAIDHVDLADALAPQRVRDREAAMARAHDHDVVVRSGARAHPIRGVAPGPAQHAARLLVELLARGELRVRRARRRRRTARLGWRLGEHRTRAEAADGERRSAAKKSPAVDSARSVFTFVGHRSFPSWCGETAHAAARARVIRGELASSRPRAARASAAASVPGGPAAGAGRSS